MSNLTTAQQDAAITLVPVAWDWRLMVQLGLAIIGVLGNSLVIHIYRSNRDLKGNTTNLFIAALAIADLITSICIIPFPLLSRAPQNVLGSIYCKVVFSSNVMWVSIVASIITLTTLSVERYIAVAFPTHYKRIFTKSKTTLIIVCIWLFAFAMNTFGYYETFVINGQCTHVIPSNEFQLFLGVAVFLVEYLIPMIIMLATNIRTIQLLHKQAKVFGGNDTKNGPALSLLRARRRVVYMLLIVILAFIICWSPDQIAFLGFNIGFIPFGFAFGHVYRAFIALAFANSCFNPAIYIIANRNFRKAFLDLLPSRRRTSSDSHTNTLFETPVDGDDTGITNKGRENFGAFGDDGKTLSTVVSDSRDKDEGSADTVALEHVD
ncbi:kappa-type opioid receptor-like [Amphiura filiformis]|uniref:kappa-type opioid receptor-like n=1 Tax=Amphiura filiformis TaxID=82378 RepID=UPI003B225A56